MAFVGINYIAVVAAAVAGFLFGFAWYGILGNRWMAALGKTRDQLLPGGKAPVEAMVLTALAQLVMAWMLAGLMGHLGSIDISTGLVAALAVWVGFVLTTTIVNHRFQRASWSLTIIDGGHWLGVLLVQGFVLGVFGL